MKKIFALVAVLFLVVSVSGCVEGGGGIFSGLMGTGGETKEAPDDILKMKDTTVVPNPPIPADNDFSFSFRVKNLDNKKSARDTFVKVYDTGRCDMTRTDDFPDERGPFDMFPGSTRVFKWWFEAPNNSELGNMEGSCPLRYQTSYNFDAYTRSEAVVVTQARIDEASRSGETIEASPSETKSRGPIKVDVRFGTDQPFRNGSVVPFSVVVQNKGEGEVAELKNREVTINISGQDFGQWDCFNGSSGDGEMKEDCRLGCFYPNQNESSGKNTKNKTIPFLEGETPHIRCSHRFDIGSSGPKRTYTVEVDIENYTYEISGIETVTVKPTYEP